MSDECCGAERSASAKSPVSLTRVPRQSAAPSCGCCDHDEPSAAGLDESRECARPVADDGDACCGPNPAPLFGASKDDDEEAVRPPWWRDLALLPSAISGAALVAGYGLQWSGLGTAATVLHWVALLSGAYTFVPGTLLRLIHGRIGVGLLMTIAAVGAVILGHVGEAAALAFLFSLSEALEDRAMDRAKEGLRALLSLIPDTARVERNGAEETIPVARIRELDLLVVGAGDRVATDGVVAQGRSSLDTSAVTGESIPVSVEPGDQVLAGSVNGSGTLLIEATADGRDNSLTQIVALVEQAHAKKGERARLADRIARPLVPAVLIIAALIAVFGFIVGDPGLWIERALVVLVAASPCAMAIAVPVTVISAIGSASKYGVVIKSGQAFEQLGTISTVAQDKTGTLTRGEPQVVEVASNQYPEQELLAFAAALETSSSHPLAAAITAASPEAPAGRDIEEDAGHGLSGTAGITKVRVGNTRWLDPGEYGEAAERMAAQGITVVAVETDGAIAGLIGVRDELRPESAQTIAMLDAMGIATVMLTGDNPRTAHALAAQAGISDVKAGQLPRDKAEAVASLASKGPTAMVGDGINDTPALATATVGIAMGAKGSAAAIESADVAFTGDDLRLIPAALAHARRGRRIMTVNIGLALAIIVTLFPLALFGVLGLAGVVLVHEVAEVLVILNGIRAAQRPAAQTAPEPDKTA